VNKGCWLCVGDRLYVSLSLCVCVCVCSSVPLNWGCDSGLEGGAG